MQSWMTICNKKVLKGVAGRNLHMKMDKEKLMITLVYVDDLIFASNDEEMSHEFSLNMSKIF